MPVLRLSRLSILLLCTLPLSGCLTLTSVGLLERNLDALRHEFRALDVQDVRIDAHEIVVETVLTLDNGRQQPWAVSIDLHDMPTQRDLDEASLSSRPLVLVESFGSRLEHEVVVLGYVDDGLRMLPAVETHAASDFEGQRYLHVHFDDLAPKLGLGHFEVQGEWVVPQTHHSGPPPRPYALRILPWIALPVTSSLLVVSAIIEAPILIPFVIWSDKLN
ncbi:MAG: hypothetical protein KDC38_14785 [Planctomycetes bacterium]|nr:hypothetical protein [Planctomycetota bacterium]